MPNECEGTELAALKGFCLLHGYQEHFTSTNIDMKVVCV